MQFRPRRSNPLIMGRRCSICSHPERKAIDSALLDASTGYRKVAKRFNLSEAATFRHRQNHLSAVVARAFETRQGPRPDPSASIHPAIEARAHAIAKHTDEVESQKDQQAIDTYQQLRAINAACLEVLREARRDGKHSILLRAVDRIARQIELQARLLGQIQDGNTVNVAISPEWREIRQTVIVALQPFPEARQAVAQALEGSSS